MNRTITRLKLIFLSVFAILSVGTFVYHIFWAWPGQKCEAAGDWWDWRSRTCARPLLISDITGRVIKDNTTHEAAKAHAAKARSNEGADLTRPAAKN
jgi:hypothetical protein